MAGGEDLEHVRDAWGKEHFEVADPSRLEGLPLRAEDRELLTEVGLPVGPDNALTLQLRFETILVQHRPSEIGLLSATEFEPGRNHPRPDEADLDWLDLDEFVVLGRVPNDFDRDPSYFATRFVCVEAARGSVWWVYPAPVRGKTLLVPINTSLPRYLQSFLAYKDFREEWTDLADEYSDTDEALEDADYREEAGDILEEFLLRLREIDPEFFPEGFWIEHATNEAILMEIDPPDLDAL